MGDPHDSADGCPECGSSDWIEIELTLPEGTEVLFCSCPTCEARWWNRDGQQIALGDVLKLAGKAKSR